MEKLENNANCTECGNSLDKFSFDCGYEQCEPCSILDVNEWFESQEQK